MPIMGEMAQQCFRCVCSSERSNHKKSISDIHLISIICTHCTFVDANSPSRTLTLLSATQIEVTYNALLLSLLKLLVSSSFQPFSSCKNLHFFLFKMQRKNMIEGACAQVSRHSSFETLR